MIIREIVVINETEYQKHYSNKGFMIQKVGTNEVYIDAIDTMNCNYQYTETDVIISEEIPDEVTNE